MNASYIILLTSVVGLAIFCEKTGHATFASQPPPATFEKAGSNWVDSDFTDWKSRAELQYFQDNITSGQYFAHVEGRNNGGRLEYRAVPKPFPSDRYQQWAVFWGIDEAELFDWELRLLRGGFERKEMQTFTDPAGKSIHQIVWLQPTGSLKSAEIKSSAQLPTGSVAADRKDPEPSEQPVIISDPSDPPDSPTEVSPPPEPPKPVVVAVPKSYTIQPGDTVEKIARRHRISVATLQAANHLKSDYLRSGKKLVIPAPE